MGTAAVAENHRARSAVFTHHFMLNSLRPIMAVGCGLLFTPIMAVAQTADDSSGGHRFSDLLLTIGPIVLVMGVILFVIRRRTSSLTKHHQEYLARHLQHMERMEQLNERIANALEKD